MTAQTTIRQLGINLYKEAGLEVSLELIPDGGHVPKEFWDPTRREMTLKFLDKHLK